MNDDPRVQAVKAYFAGLAAKDMSRVPWSENATLRTPLNPAGGDPPDPGAQGNSRIFQRNSAGSPEPYIPAPLRRRRRVGCRTSGDQPG